MNFQKVQKKNRKAISPVLATVILIAITLIAAVAIAGFVFGLFGSFTSSAQVSASPSINHTDAQAAVQASFTCGTTAPANSYVLLTNAGTSPTNALTVSVSAGGKTVTLNAAATCTVAQSGAASNIEYISLTGLGFSSTQAAPGVQYTGSVSMSNGGSAAFTGTFQ
jgi:archaeal type IV pilus assembly protein PilA